jgi:hypothetical protein
MPFISFSIIPAIQGGVCDLQPCLLSQLMQYPCFGLIMALSLAISYQPTAFSYKPVKRKKKKAKSRK